MFRSVRWCSWADWLTSRSSQISLMWAQAMLAFWAHQSQTGQAMDQALSARCSDLERAIDRLSLLSSHDALVILKSALSTPKLLYTLRTSPCSDHPELEHFDALLRSGLSSIVNINISDVNWIQSSLPVSDGGLGIRSAALLAPSAFLASAAGTKDLQSKILAIPYCGGWPLDCTHCAGLDWQILRGGAIDWGSPPSEKLGPGFDQACIRNSFRECINWSRPGPTYCCDITTQWRLAACAAGLFVRATPWWWCHTRGDWFATRHTPLRRAHLQLWRMGRLHGYPWSLVQTRYWCCLARHQQLNDLVWRALERASIPSCREPRNLLRDSELRPDGLTFIPWKEGKCLTWDVTVADTFAATYVSATSVKAGEAAARLAAIKRDKYEEITHTHLFCPIAVETMGPVENEGRDLLSAIGHLITKITGDPRETSFLFQRLSVIIQRGNAAAFRGTFPRPTPDTF